MRDVIAVGEQEKRVLIPHLKLKLELNIVACLLKASREQPLLRNDSAKTPVSRQQLHNTQQC
jgi:hypothetical protein